MDFILRVPPEVKSRIEALAEKRNTSKSGLALQAFGLLQVVDEAKARGEFIGTSRDRHALDVVLLDASI
jgi:predicted transcriptional regulator